MVAKYIRFYLGKRQRKRKHTALKNVEHLQGRFQPDPRTILSQKGHASGGGKGVTRIKPTWRMTR